MDGNISTSRFENILLHLLIFNKLFLLLIIIKYSEEEKPAFSFDIDLEVAGLRKKQSQVNSRIMNKGLGDWEKHTKGIGAKLLLGVNYKYYLLSFYITNTFIMLCFKDGLPTRSWFRKKTSRYYSSN